MKNKYNAGFALVGEHSSYNAAFGLARVLQDRGHVPIFVVEKDTVFAQLVTRHGFKTAVIPSGHELHFAKPEKTGWFRLWRRLKKRTENIRMEQDFLTDLIKTNAIDVFFLDAIKYDVYPYALALAKESIPTSLLSYTFASKFGLDYPPVFASAISRSAKKPALISRLMHAALWVWALATRGRSQAFGRFEYTRLVIKKCFNLLRNIGFERKLRRYGWQSVWSEYKRRPHIPEIVFGHRILDWPAIAADPYRYYFGATDSFREDSGFDWSEFDQGKPIVYCNLSTINGFESVGTSESERHDTKEKFSTKRFRMARQYVDAVIACFSKRQEWQVVIACGPFYHELKEKLHTDNIHLYDRLPQLAILKRTDLVITWGGTGTIRECINHAVPMVVLPAWTDQFGNAARVVSCRIGVRGDLVGITPEKLLTMVETVLTEPRFISALSRFQSPCDLNQETEELVQFIGRHSGMRI